jgi:hypothetical protein
MLPYVNNSKSSENESIENIVSRYTGAGEHGMLGSAASISAMIKRRRLQ